MVGLVAAFALFGYSLVYAAVANGGRFAATPWDGFRSSAYDGHGSSSSAQSGSHGGIVGTIIGIGIGIGKRILLLPPFLP